MPYLSESDTRAKLIDPAIHSRGWTEDLIRREETAGAITIVDGKPRKQSRGRVDYILRVTVNSEAQPVAVALIEAKAEHLPPTHGLEQARAYADSKRLHVPFVIATNGHLFVIYDRFTGLTSAARPITEFPTPEELRLRFEQGIGFGLAEPVARPLLARYPGGEATRRYYQDAAIRAVLEKIARCEKTGQPKRALLSLATGAGKTFIAVHLLKRIADAGQLHRALFICDRDELRGQAAAAFQNVFGNDAATVSAGNAQKNARILIATYQTLDVDSDEADASFLIANYSENYFSHIIIDECHRSAWGKWSIVLKRNPNAVQIGLTATPRELVGAGLVPAPLAPARPGATTGATTRVAPTSVPHVGAGLAPARPGAITGAITRVAPTDAAIAADLQITADNIRHFGEAVYEYDMSQGIEDGYLAACEIRKSRVNLDATGITIDDILARNPVDATTGQSITRELLQELYDKTDYEDRILLPDRVLAMARDLFNYLLETGGPEQKTIIFCVRDRHADDVAIAMNNLYAAWCQQDGKKPVDHYTFKCTAASAGNSYLADLRGSSRNYFVATTVDLLSTGVDVPIVSNIVFFKYVRSPIAFYQMVGRGTRLHAPTGKLMFRVYDYTDATRLFGQEFRTKFVSNPRTTEPGPEWPPPPPVIQVEGFDVHVTPAGRYIVTQVDGKAMPVTVEEYKERLAARLVDQAPTLEIFRVRWINPAERRELLGRLPDAGRSATLVQSLEQMADYDLYDVLAELGYGLAPRTRAGRANAFTYKHAGWLDGLPLKAAATIKALASQFARAGTEGLENLHIFETKEVRSAGGLAALSICPRTTSGF